MLSLEIQDAVDDLLCCRSLFRQSVHHPRYQFFQRLGIVPTLRLVLEFLNPQTGRFLIRPEVFALRTIDAKESLHLPDRSTIQYSGHLQEAAA